jgi:hypothetical protein
MFSFARCDHFSTLECTGVHGSVDPARFCERVLSPPGDGDTFARANLHSIQAGVDDGGKALALRGKTAAP